MPPASDELFWKWKTIYKELLDPGTGTVPDKYFYPLLDAQLCYCKKNGIPLSIAILDILNLPNSSYGHMTLEAYLLIGKISNMAKVRLSSADMVFYNGKQSFIFMFPKTNKESVHKLSENIKKDIEDLSLNVKGGYAEFPGDAADPIGLEKCAREALAAAGISNGNGIIGYFTERRKNPRAPLQVEVRYNDPDSCGRLTCSRNISEKGIMVSGMPDLTLDKEIKLILNLPGINHPKITILAKTIWNRVINSTGKMDIGLYFNYLNDTVKEYIRRFVAKAVPPIVNL